MNRVQFGRAVYAVGREASIFHDYIKLCTLAGQNTMRVIDLLATVRTEGNTVKQRVDALLEDGQLCEKLLLQHGAQPQSQRKTSPAVWTPQFHTLLGEMLAKIAHEAHKL